MNAISCNGSRSSRRAASPVARAAARCSFVTSLTVSIADLPYTLGAAFLFIIANLFPIVGLEVAGIAKCDESLWSGRGHLEE